MCVERRTRTIVSKKVGLCVRQGCASDKGGFIRAKTRLQQIRTVWRVETGDRFDVEETARIRWDNCHDACQERNTGENKKEIGGKKKRINI